MQNYRDVLAKIKKESKILKPSDLIKFIVSESGLAEQYKRGTEDDLERLSNMKELVSLAIKYDEYPLGKGIEKLLEEVALTSDQDEIDKDITGAVKLMTVHAAKGLEFDYVFITGLEDGLFPSKMMAENSIEKNEEERRLFYVALTRARKKLFLSYTSMRTIFGSRRSNTISEFITDIPESLLEYTDAGGDSLSQDGEEKIQYLEW